MALEATSREAGIPARSVAWDPARMIGWKLHVSMPGLQPRHLRIAANSVLVGIPHDLATQQHPGPDFSGSLFADYAYYVSMSAPRMTPWEATRCLFTKLLNLRELEQLLGKSGQAELFSNSTEADLAKELLHQWGWKEKHTSLPRPILGCLKADETGRLALSKSLNETRISFEGLLKDLIRITFSSLGWSEEEVENQLLVHCPDYRRNEAQSWSDEMNLVTGGGAIILLKNLMPLAFPEQCSKEIADDLALRSSRLLKFLNSGSHDPPPPPPSPEEMANNCQAIQEIVKTSTGIVGEMPWHLNPVQAFGSDPAIVTGHAWSHSHLEERLIRVMLWSGSKPSNGMLVWNKSLTNPVMTDAIVV
jgi:hypothetical protein